MFGLIGGMFNAVVELVEDAVDVVFMCLGCADDNHYHLHDNFARVLPAPFHAGAATRSGSLHTKILGVCVVVLCVYVKNRPKS